MGTDSLSHTKNQVAFVDPCFSQALFQLGFAVLTPSLDLPPVLVSVCLAYNHRKRSMLDVVVQLPRFLFVAHAFTWTVIEAGIRVVRNRILFACVGFLCWMLVGGVRFT